MRYLKLDEVLELHEKIIERLGGATGIRDIGALQSALAQPQMTFGGQELYPKTFDKAAALGFSLIQNHAFVDGNKRVGHASMEVFLILNGYQFDASIDEQEEVVLQVASSQLSQDEFAQWVAHHMVEKT